MTLRFHHWVLAGAGAMFCHAALAYAFFTSPPPMQGAKAEGSGGLEISISMVAAAIGQQTQQEVLALEEEAMDEPVEVEKVEEAPEPQAEPTLPVKPKEIVETTVQPAIVPTPQEKPKPPVKNKPVIQKTSEQKKPVKEAPRPKQLGLQSQGVSAQSTLKATRSDATSQQGGSRIVGHVTPDYITTLRYWLEKHKTYPKNAKRRRQQGVVIISFSITREGQIPHFQIQKGSGFESLDEETIAMLKRAQPLPKLPQEMEGDILNITLPVQFSLR